jgi:GH35 family endo-1,4-beta-xylanase
MWLPNDVPTVKKYLDKRIAEIAERYADKIPSMEVINETQCGEKDLDYRHSTRFFREPDIVEWSFEHARKYLPANELIINEATSFCWSSGFKYNRSAYYMQIERALSKGASMMRWACSTTHFTREKWKRNKQNCCMTPKICTM